VHDGSLGSVLQSTGPPGGVVVLHDGSFGVVLQSIGPSGGGDERMEIGGGVGGMFGSMFGDNRK
jgi:hypothetical protein